MSKDKVTPINKGKTLLQQLVHHAVDKKYTTAKFTIYGVQIWFHGKCEGVAMYKEQADAKEIEKTLNEQYAKIGVAGHSKAIVVPVEVF